MFSAFLDANALVPISLVDTILRCADEELFRPLWSERILSEAHRAIVRVEPSLADSRVEYRLNRMKAAFPEAMVRNYQSLEDQIVIPDPDDRHVVAAAYVGSADLIVTNNLKDFPDSILTQFGLEAVTPDRFLQDMLDLAPTIVHRVIVAQASDAQNPPRSIIDVLIALGRAGAIGFVKDFRGLYPVEN